MLIEELSLPIIPDFEKSELIGWYIQGELKSRDSNILDKRDVLRRKALEAEVSLLKAMDAEDYFLVKNNKVFCESYGSFSDEIGSGTFIESYRYWYSFFLARGLEQHYLNWISFRWLVPTTSYYRWASGVNIKRERKLRKRLQNSKGVEQIWTDKMTGQIDRFWHGAELESLSIIERKVFNVLTDRGITSETKALLSELPSDSLRVMYDALHMTLAEELARNPDIMFRPLYGYREGSSIYYWSGIGRIPKAMKERMHGCDMSEVRLGSDLMREWRKRNQIFTTVHTENFVEIQACSNS